MLFDLLLAFSCAALASSMAYKEDNAEVDVDVNTGDGTGVDEDGRRINVRDSFMSRGGASSGLRL